MTSYNRSSNQRRVDREVVEPGEVGISVTTVKMLGEMRGITSMADASSQLIADHVTLILRNIVQDCVKSMRNSKRMYLTTQDVDTTLINKGMEPIYGINTSKMPVFHHARGGGRDIFFQDDLEVELKSIINRDVNKVAYDHGLINHWLAIEGLQPAVPENPAPLLSDSCQGGGPGVGGAGSDLLLGGGRVSPGGTESNETSGELKPRPLRDLIPTGRSLDKHNLAGSAGRHKMGPELAVFKEVRMHELSTEQQIYFRELTEACVGSLEERRQEALDSLSADSGLHQLLPRIVTFVAEGVRANTVAINLAILIYLMRMIKCLLDNPHLHLEKYLHRLVPTIISCVVCKQLCARPEADNHWALRDFAARQLAIICNKYTTPTNRLLQRITELLVRALVQDPQSNSASALVTVYGAAVALCDLGPATIRHCLLPALPAITTRITEMVESQGASMPPGDAKAVHHFRSFVAGRIAPILAEDRPSSTDSLEAYRSEFGCMGTSLHSALMAIRNTAQHPPSSSATTTSASTMASSVSVPVVTASLSAASSAVSGASVVVVSSSPATAATHHVMVNAPSNNPLATASGILFNRTTQQRF